MNQPAQIKAIIFDLDNCLAAADEPGRQLFEPAFQAIRRANNGTMPADTLEEAFARMWFEPFTYVSKTSHFSQSMFDAGWNAFSKIEVTTPMRGYGDLEMVNQFPHKKFLVTSGFRKLQQSKINALGLAPILTKIIIDALEDDHHRGKQFAFEQLMKEFRVSPNEVLVVGDNPASEIAVGNKLGMPTVQTLRPNVKHDPSAKHHVRDLNHLKNLLAET